MRKTLAVLVLVISSMLLLQAPAWAPTASTTGAEHHLYRITKPPGQPSQPNAEGLRRTVYVVLTDCPSVASITSSAWRPPTVNGTFAGTEEYQGATGYKYQFVAFLKSGQAATTGNTTVQCTMAMTGRPSAHQLLLGMGLLLVGIMLLMVTGRLPAGLVRRRSGRATPS
jgi:hypothetical protein